MTDSELIQFATFFRDGILNGRTSHQMCAAICWPLSTLLELYGVPNEVVESDLGDLDFLAMNHVWLKLSDGRALDPTADQFGAHLPAVYLGKPLAIHP